MRIAFVHIPTPSFQLGAQKFRTQVQGSYAQGLALRGSDLDVAVIEEAMAKQKAQGAPRLRDILFARRLLGKSHREIQTFACVYYTYYVYINVHILCAYAYVLKSIACTNMHILLERHQVSEADELFEY